MLPLEIDARLKEHFSRAGFETTAPLNLSDSKGETDLVVAGVQMYDDIIHHNRPIRKNKMFVAQPCVRMQFQPQIETTDGFSTSFVNVCTEQMDGSFDDHLAAFDRWLAVLSALGLHMNDTSLVVDITSNDWGTGEFAAMQLFVVYGALELGDAGYASIPNKDHILIPVSDIGFGLERLSWAINKTDAYFDLLAPFAIKAGREKLDVCRTLALLAICGVRPSNKGPGLQFRRLAKILSDKYYGNSLFFLVEYYADYWRSFLETPVASAEVVRMIRLEAERFINLSLSSALELPMPREETTEEYLQRLFHSHNINIGVLRRAFSELVKE